MQRGRNAVDGDVNVEHRDELATGRLTNAVANMIVDECFK